MAREKAAADGHGRGGTRDGRMMPGRAPSALGDATPFAAGTVAGTDPGRLPGGLAAVVARDEPPPRPVDPEAPDVARGKRTRDPGS